jgi:hypothetical protein
MDGSAWEENILCTYKYIVYVNNYYVPRKVKTTHDNLKRIVYYTEINNTLDGLSVRGPNLLISGKKKRADSDPNWMDQATK